MKRNIHIIIGSILLVVIAAFIWNKQSRVPNAAITTFEECVAAGNPVMESYPEQCAANGKTFTKAVGNEVEKNDLIRLTSPRPGQTVRSPLIITGEARGNWYFEATFPVVVTDWNGLIIGEGYAQAEGEWMTTEFVPFKATVSFTVPTSTPYKRGNLILQKSNASGLPEHNDALEIPILFQ